MTVSDFVFDDIKKGEVHDIIQQELVFLVNRISMYKDSLGKYRLIQPDWIIDEMIQILGGVKR